MAPLKEKLVFAPVKKKLARYERIDLGVYQGAIAVYKDQLFQISAC
jgi:hypothetical protein